MILNYKRQVSGIFRRGEDGRHMMRHIVVIGSHISLEILSFAIRMSMI